MWKSQFLILSLLPVIVTSQCSPGSIYNSDRNKCFTIYRASVDFKTAESICVTSNGHLASIHNTIDNNFLTKQALKDASSNGVVWLGAQAFSSDVTNPSNWNWTDGTPFNYQNYQPGQPTALRTDACMQLSVVNSKWLTASCNNYAPFICEYEGTLPVTCAPYKITSCPSGYYYLESTKSCYKTVIKEYNYDQALSYCKSDGGDLASVHSTYENNFLTGISKTGLSVSKHISVYIGLIYTNGYWHWTDGTSTDYLNWASGEPNNMKKEFWTAIMPDPIEKGYDPYGGEWNNVENINNRGFICKQPLH